MKDYFLSTRYGMIDRKVIWRVIEWDPVDKCAYGIIGGNSMLYWKKFICVENGTFTKERAYILRPGERHTLVCTIVPN